MYRVDNGKRNKLNTAVFNKRGLITKSTDAFGDVEKYKYTMKNGRVRSVVYNSTYDSDMSNKVRYKFTYYTKKKISKSRYAKMINSLITSYENVFVWY